MTTFGESFKTAGTVDAERRPGRPRSATAEAAILEATLELLAEHGVAGVTIEQVATLAGVAKTTIYRRWSDKHGLILDALIRLKGPVPMPPGHSVRDDLMYLLKAARDRHHHEKADRVMSRLFADASTYPDLIAALRDRIVTPRRVVWRNVLERGVAEGLIRPDAQLELAVEMMISPVILCDVSRAHQHSDGELESIADTILDGLAPTSIS